MADKMMRVAGRDDTGKARAVNIDGYDRVKTSPGEIEEIVVFDLYEIRDTELHAIDVDISKYRTVRWKVLNTHDEPVNLYFSWERIYGTGSFQRPFIWNGNEWVREEYRELKIGSGGMYDITSKLDWISWGRRYRVHLKCDVEPNVGSITITIEGAPN